MDSTGKRWLTDAEVEEATGGAITRRRLQKDRITAQVFPFRRIGKLCFYSLVEVEAVIERARFGGKQQGQKLTPAAGA